jgi:aryl-phospho-beta-D-glucosidase BglC (GH1 family)
VGGDTLVTDPTVGAVDRAHPRLAVITEVIDYALSQPDLYVVLNAHHEKALKTERRAAVLERLWQDIVELFGDRSHRLVFELLNEPHAEGEGSPAMPAADLRAMTGLAYDAVRAKNPERIVIIGGNQWFGASEVPAVWTSLDEVGGGADPFVMATFHHYNPWTFCGDNQGTYDDPWTEAQLLGPMQTMQNWADTVGGGMPVYIGEWGVAWASRYEAMNCNNVRAWYEAFLVGGAETFGQPTALWDDGGWFEVYSHASDSFESNLIDCLEGECAWDGEERFNADCQ